MTLTDIRPWLAPSYVPAHWVPLTVPEALAKLEALGNPDRIANFFRYEGILGHRRKMAYCPVARWLQKVTGVDNVWVAPCPIGRVAWVGSTPHFQRDEGWKLPRAVNKFALYFDAGEYEDLRDS